MIPAAIHVSASIEIHSALLPALGRLAATIARRGNECADVVETGLTPLMDALPLPLAQEFGAWESQLRELRDPAALTYGGPPGQPATR